jgi:outer membrane protein W
MRTFIIALVFLMFTQLLAVAQNNQDFANLNCVKKDNFIVEVLYGWPYFNGVLLSSISSTRSVKNSNHIGGKIEYFLTENTGIGAEVTYANASIQYQSGNNSNWYDVGISKLRVLGKFNYHFSTTKTVDPYITVGMGYKKTTFYDTGNAAYNQSFNIFPVSFKLAIGTRIFFNDTFGFNAEIGVGGPLISAGIGVKI